MDLLEELGALVGGLESRRVPYALAGALALAVHGVSRATADIDLLVPADAIDDALAVAHDLGFDLPARPMTFAEGPEIRRVTKIAGADTLTLDLLVGTDPDAPEWLDRIVVGTEFGPLTVVSRDGLIRMKTAAGRDQDLVDVRRLRELDR